MEEVRGKLRVSETGPFPQPTDGIPSEEQRKKNGSMQMTGKEGKGYAKLGGEQNHRGWEGRGKDREKPSYERREWGLPVRPQYHRKDAGRAPNRKKLKKRRRLQALPR